MEKEISQIVNRLPIGIYRSTPDGRVMFANDYIIKLLGYSDFNEFIDANNALTVYKNQNDRAYFINELIEKKEIKGKRYVWKSKNGDSVIVKESTKVFFNENGEIDYFEGIIENITQKEELILLSEKNEALYKNIFEFANDAIFIMKNGIFIECNKHAEILFEADKDYIIGKTPVDFSPLYQLSGITSDFEAYTKIRMAENGQQQFFEWTHMTKTNKQIYCEVSLSRVKLNDGDIILAAVRDISNRKYSEFEQQKLYDMLKVTNEQLEVGLLQKNSLINELENSKNLLEQAVNEKDKFFSILAHDLKSPFSSFLGMTKVLSESLGDMSLVEIQKNLSDLSHLAQNLHKLLENLLEWSRVQRGMFEFSPDNFLLYNLVENVVGIKGIKAKNKNIEIHNNVPENLMVFADLNMINTIIRNLISNALKFTNRDGKIVISTKNVDNDYIEFRITDYGIGMTEEIKSKLFSLKDKISTKGTENEPGTGLGLLLCKEFAELHGSNLKVESEPGKGSTFYFNIKKSYNK